MSNPTPFGETLLFVSFGLVAFVGLLLIFAIIRLVVRLIQQARDSAAASLIDAFRKDVESGEFARRLQSPKSLSGMDAVYGPQIARDFPELNLDELKQRARNLAATTLEAIAREDFGLLSERSELYNSQLTAYLAGLQSVGEHEQFGSAVIHNIVLSDYRKTAGTCRIGFELAVGADYVRTGPSGQVVAGGTWLTQFKATIEALYIQDQSQAVPDLQALGVNCPNCGAPVETLGIRTCAYCGTAIEPLNARVWTFCSFDLTI